MILWPDREADGANETTTPSKMGARDEMGRLEKVCLVRSIEIHALQLRATSSSRSTREAIYQSPIG